MEHFDVLCAKHPLIMPSTLSLGIWVLSIMSCCSTACVAQTTVAALPEYSAREKAKVRSWPAARSTKANSLGRKAREFVCSPFGTQ
jgi:hypothetical protein